LRQPDVTRGKLAACSLNERGVSGRGGVGLQVGAGSTSKILTEETYMLRFAIMLVLPVALVGCANQVQTKEDMLAAAGFTLVPANTPQRQASLSSLPPHKFVHQVRGNKVLFTYADPTICDCLYVGDQAAYDRYRANVFQKQIADEQQMTAQINEMNWGPWGPGWYY
jgi:hypothetical protein